MDENVSKKEVAVTYETLYEILRLEKQRDELQQLDNGFLIDVLSYLREKQRILDEAEQKEDMFSLDEREKTQVQLVNIRKIIRELYERREKKIVEMALNKSRTKSNLVDTSTVLVHERYLFDSIVSVLDNFRGSVLHSVLSLQEPKLTVDSSMPEVPNETPSVTKETPTDAPSVPKEKLKEVQPIETPPLPPEAFKQVKFTKPVEQFVGKELELYGPFQPEQKEQLPADIADILIEQGSAVEVSPE